jgi:hypothetical protein
MSHFDSVTSSGQTEAIGPSLALQVPNQYQAHVVTRQSSENSDSVNQTFDLVPLHCSRHLTKQLCPSVCLSVRSFPDICNTHSTTVWIISANRAQVDSTVF